MSPSASPERVPILLVDDRPANLLALRAVLESSPEYDLVTSASGDEALERIANADFAVVLLDVQMPSMDGFETATKMRQILGERGRHVPIIFLTAIDSSDARILEAYSTGAVDFIQKPVHPDVLRAKVAVFIALYRARSDARQRLQALTTLARELSPARTRAEVANVIIEHGMRAARADTCTLYALDEDGAALVLLGERGAPPEIVERIRRISERDGNPATFALFRAGVATWAENDADYERIFPALATMKTQGKRARAFWSMPLVVEKRAIGLLGMGFYEPRRFSTEDRAFVEAFVMLCAQALLRALRLEREERDRVRTIFLAKAGEAFVSSLDYAATLRTVAQLAVPELADWCAVDLLEPGAAEARQVVVAHLDPEKIASAQRLNERYPPDPDAPPVRRRSFARESPSSTKRFPRRSSKRERGTQSTSA
jgi:CheY-like chemotaxis protein